MYFALCDIKAQAVLTVCILDEEKVICYQLELRNLTCWRFDWMLQSSSGQSEEVQTNAAIYSHALRGYMSLEVKVQWGLVLPPCLLITAVQQPRTSSPAGQLWWGGREESNPHWPVTTNDMYPHSSVCLHFFTSPWWQQKHSVETSASYFSSSSW